MKIHLNEKEEHVFEHIKHIFNYTFQSLLVLFLLTLLVREFYPNFINSRININWFMLVVIIIGGFSILFPPKYKEFRYKKATKKDFIFVSALGVAGAIVIFLKLDSLGWIGYAISILGGVIITLLGWLILDEDFKDK